MVKQTSSNSGWSKLLKNFFASNGFFYGILAFIGVSSVYVALVSLYPMAFDEEVHLGIIKAYSELWNPFDLVQKSAYDSFGPIVTDPSWLYHYLMSFPYRLLSVFTDSETTIIIILRILNVPLFLAAIWVYRKVLLAAGLSRAKTHIILAVFALLPIAPLLAGQINYDNLVLLVTAGLFWYAIQVWQGLKRERTVKLWPTIAVVNLLLYGSLVKYAFLPIALGTIFVLLVACIVVVKNHHKKMFKQIVKDWNAYSVPLQLALFLLCFVGIFLFSQRYVLNEVQYGSMVPKCNVVLGEDRCQAFGPYARDSLLVHNKPQDFVPKNLPDYIATEWYTGMTTRLYFALAGPTNEYATRLPLPIPMFIARILFLAGLVAVLVFSVRIFKEFPLIWLFIVPSALYIGILMVRLHGAYVNTGEPVAINGRYLVPLLPLLGAVLVIGYDKLLHTLHAAKFAGILAAFVLLLLLQGGGPFTYIIYGEPTWFWPDSPAPAANQTVQDAVKPFIIE